METTLILIKPDGVQRSLSGEIIQRLERSGLKISGLKLLHVDEALAKKHYAEHDGKPFFNDLVEYICSAPIIALAISGPNAVQKTRTLIGKTNPLESEPGTIRGDFGLEISRNLIHGSASTEDAEREVNIFFEKNEIINYKKSTDNWVLES
ncbi:MAG: nucleoside-diphosphate kinase [Dehalococcoidia bacterium]|nr:MAG: nucleoside-diphosphate kinase [Chloroflexota bacterium]|tara:strand:+ start:6950 stop:7402 length:453 start_codon:yes stop_codon:yes gene_type:complete